MYYNGYAFTRTGERVIIDLGMPYGEAVARCLYEAEFIASMGDPLTRCGDTWFDEGWCPRVALHDVRVDPFRDAVQGIVWLPESV